MQESSSTSSRKDRAIGLMAKIQAYELQDNSFDTIEANQKLGFDGDHRRYTVN